MDIIILTGSYARGTQKKTSDIDILVLTEYTNHFYTESVYQKEAQKQYMYAPINKLFSMIIENSSQNGNVLLSMLKSSIVISDRNNVGQSFVDFADSVDIPPGEQLALIDLRTGEYL